jgi:LysM repeat protein
VQVDYQKRACTKSTCYKGFNAIPPYPIFSACDAKTDVPGASAKVRIHTTLTPALVPDGTGLQKVEVHSSNTVEKLEGPSNLMLNIVGVLTLGIGSKAIQDETNHQIGNLAEELPSPSIGLAKLPKLRKIDPQVTFTLDTPKFFMDQGRLKFAVSSITKQTDAVACDIRKQAVQAQRFFQSCASLINQYEVVAGDNLWKVADKLYGDGQYYHVVANANGLAVGERDNLRPGTNLVTPPFYEIASGNDVLVESGDSLWQIAEKQRGDGRRFKELRGLNGSELDPASLPVLESVQIPASTKR